MQFEEQIPEQTTYFDWKWRFSGFVSIITYDQNKSNCFTIFVHDWNTCSLYALYFGEYFNFLSPQIEF